MELCSSENIIKYSTHTHKTKSLKARHVRCVTLVNKEMKHELTITKIYTKVEICRNVKASNTSEVSSVYDGSRVIPFLPTRCFPLFLNGCSDSFF